MSIDLLGYIHENHVDIIKGDIEISIETNLETSNSILLNTITISNQHANRGVYGRTLYLGMITSWESRWMGFNISYKIIIINVKQIIKSIKIIKRYWC